MPSQGPLVEGREPVHLDQHAVTDMRDATITVQVWIGKSAQLLTNLRERKRGHRSRTSRVPACATLTGRVAVPIIDVNPEKVVREVDRRSPPTVGHRAGLS